MEISYEIFLCFFPLEIHDIAQSPADPPGQVIHWWWILSIHFVAPVTDMGVNR